MNPIWNDDLKVGVDMMDTDHRAFLDLLAAFADTDDAGFVTLLGRLLQHLTEHFQRENALMLEHDFFAYPYHAAEHEAVLEDVRSRYQAALAGDLTKARTYIDEVIGTWFLHHRNTMDWVTAQFILGDTSYGCSMM
ncbi:MAG: hemerythrin domain-containing protein [Rhodospirillaceae bacterium]